MQTRFRAQDWTLACALADALLDRFEDRERGGFWFTSHDHERLYHRTKPVHDNATPSGNGIAAQALITLGHLAAEPRYVDAAERAVKLFAAGLADPAGAQSTLLVALERLLAPPATIVLVGDAAETRGVAAALERAYRPDVCVVDVAGTEPPAALAQGRGAHAGRARVALPRRAMPAADGDARCDRGAARPRRDPCSCWSCRSSRGTIRDRPIQFARSSNENNRYRRRSPLPRCSSLPRRWRMQPRT